MYYAPLDSMSASVFVVLGEVYCRAARPFRWDGLCAGLGLQEVH